MSGGRVTLRDVRSLLGRLGTKLVVRGFPVVPEDMEKAVRVISSLPSDVSVEELGHILAGIYSRDEKMYSEFMEIWRSMFVAEPSGEEMSRGQGSGNVYRKDIESILAEDLVRRMSKRISQKEFVPVSADVILR